MSLFLFVWFTNIFGIIPVIQMPASARIALPLFLALLAYVVYHGAGFKEHGSRLHQARPGPARRAGRPAAPRGPDRVHLEVPGAALQPHGPSLRQHARRPHPARDLRCAHRRPRHPRARRIIVFPLPFVALVFFTAFEVLVAFLQAYVFTLLTGVYINAAISHEH